MKKDELFFTPKGLSLEQADRLVTILDDEVKAMEGLTDASHDKIRFYSTYERSESSLKANLQSAGMDASALEEIIIQVKWLANCKALKAWLEAAIAYLHNLQNKKANELKRQKLEVAGIPEEDLKPPVPSIPLNESDCLQALSISDLCRYYETQAKAAEIGELIHPKGRFSKQRAAAYEKSLSPVAIVGQGQDAMVYTTKIPLNMDEIDNVFFKLQDMQREAQKNHNSFRFEFQDQIYKSRVESREKYQRELKEYYDKSNKKTAIILQANNEATEVLSLRIRIPKNFSDFYAMLTKKYAID